MKKTRQLPAFTLLEALLALLILSGSLLVYQGLSRSLVHQISYLSYTDQDRWLLFSQQLTSELEGASLDRVEGNKLYVQKGKQALAFGLTGSGDFRKTNADGRGYQPMLFGLEEARIEEDGQLVWIQLRFPSGLERTWIYDFSEKP